MENKGLEFKRSNTGINNKFKESIKIIEYSILMVEFFELKEFNNVIAIQLRLILCDTFKDKVSNKIIDNSLIKKIYMSPQLFPASRSFTVFGKGNSFITNSNLFEYTKPKISLGSWLNQVIYKLRVRETLHKITIRDFIKLYANKSGGAHVEDSLHEKALIVDIHSEAVICSIAKGLLKSIGRNFSDDSYENIKNIIEIIDSKIKAP